MLAKIQATVLLLISSAYAAFEIWGVVFGPPQELLEALVPLIFALLAFFWTGTKTVQAYMLKIEREDIDGFKQNLAA